MRAFRDRLAEGPILLDGATGTELNRRGVDTSLPLWSAAALLHSPETVRQIHADYVAAGAEVITANTFRTHERNLRAGGIADAHRAAAELTAKAVALARRAADQSAWVAGSLAPLEDCYSPHLTPDDAALDREHRQMAESLAAAGVDLILVETHNSIREALAATRAAVATGLPVLVSFVCGADGRLLSGEALSAAAGAVLPLRPDAVLVNCAPARVMEALLRELRTACNAGQSSPLAPREEIILRSEITRTRFITPSPLGGEGRGEGRSAAKPPLTQPIPREERGFATASTLIGCYANIGEADPVQGWRNTAEDAGVYTAFARSWLAAGARLIGGCCGTTPAHIARLSELIAQPASWSPTP
jgi:homocysteine S-methyltransferase